MQIASCNFRLLTEICLYFSLYIESLKLRLNDLLLMSFIDSFTQISFLLSFKIIPTNGIAYRMVDSHWNSLQHISRITTAILCHSILTLRWGQWLPKPGGLLGFPHCITLVTIGFLHIFFYLFLLLPRLY